MPHTLEERICPQCKKIFIAAPYHIYKYVDETGITMLCSYTCNLRYTEQKENERRKKDKRRIYPVDE